MSETTTDRLAEIEGQADYTPPDGWRVVRFGEQLLPGDVWVNEDGTERRSNILQWDAAAVSGGRCIRRIEPQPEPQPVQIREGRWRTRNGEIRHVTRTPDDLSDEGRYPWHDAEHCQTWYDNGRYFHEKESPFDLLDYLGPIEQPEPEPEPSITPDDVAAQALAGAWDQGKAEQQIAELRSEVSYVQGLLGDERRRFAELETLTSDLRAVNAAQEKGINLAARDKADLQHRLDTVAAEWAVQAETIRGLQTQLEAVKAELVQERLERNHWKNQAQRAETQLFDKAVECRNLRIELDALQQAPEAEAVAAVATSTDDRFEEGLYHGKARAVEMIAEWTEPFRTCGSQGLSYHVMQNLPHIMRSLTGLADND